MDTRSEVARSPELNNLVGDIYELAFKQEAVPHTLDLICRVTDSHSAILCHRDLVGGGFETIHGIDPRFHVPMRAYMHQNRAVPHVMLLPIGKAAFGAELMGDERTEEMRATELYNEVWRPAQLDHSLGTLIAQSPGTVSSVWFFRSKLKGQHGPEDLKIASMLFPHLCRAMALRRAFLDEQSRVAVLKGALDELALPVVIVDTAGLLIFCNLQAEALLRVGRPLTISNRRLAACTAPDGAKLRHLLACLAEGRGVGVALGERGGEVLSLLAAPLSHGRAFAFGLSSSKRLGLIVLSSAAITGRVDERMLETLLGLSRSEACIALAVGRGATLREVAETRKVSLHTARSQLKAVFAKTGASRQSELVRLVTGIAHLRDH